MEQLLHNLTTDTGVYKLREQVRKEIEEEADGVAREEEPTEQVVFRSQLPTPQEVLQRQKAHRAEELRKSLFLTLLQEDVELSRMRGAHPAELISLLLFRLTPHDDRGEPRQRQRFAHTVYVNAVDGLQTVVCTHVELLPTFTQTPMELLATIQQQQQQRRDETTKREAAAGAKTDRGGKKQTTAAAPVDEEALFFDLKEEEERMVCLPYSNLFFHNRVRQVAQCFLRRTEPRAAQRGNPPTMTVATLANICLWEVEYGAAMAAELMFLFLTCFTGDGAGAAAVTATTGTTALVSLLPPTSACATGAAAAAGPSTRQAEGTRSPLGAWIVQFH
ncbi:hypothetical protein STCU_11494 [Strigomonas culicis]|uniref:Uncharacterized protein n=1 Tax=Strigomonas culicis TaxID=28005 RepID=S9TH06_9TRYP|nr:hypothetical protein STCU_11494 [Strigomonas culicis]|eukprot:EPY16184.1 hypothetical protein STCU_11494 [Strigomonas culicis]